jgi:hypothetical protein
MPKPKARRLHIAIDPPVEMTLGDYRVTFDGLNLLNGVVMVEYSVTPPHEVDSPFGPHLLVVEASDDTSDELYETFWPDFPWTHIAPGRMTTRLQKRPSPEATELRFRIRPAEPPDAEGRRPWTSSLPVVGFFEVALPPEHGLPWKTSHTTSS